MTGDAMNAQLERIDTAADPCLESAAVVDGDVVLRWRGAGAVTRLSPMWLRDHCQCAACRHPETHQRLLMSVLAIPADAGVAALAIEDGGRSLRIDWRPDGHVGRYRASLFAGLRAEPDVLPVRRRLWEAADLYAEVPSVPYEAFLASDDVLREFLESVLAVGFCFVEGAPGTPEATRAVGDRIAYTRATVFGGYYDFSANLERKDTAYTSLAIGAHTDSTYSFDAPGYQMFHCLAAECTGGENVLIDGFRVAEDMRRDHPEDFDVLTRVAVPGQYIEPDRGIHLMARRPIFRLGEDGELLQMSYNNHDRAPMLLPRATEAAFYRALGTLARLLADARYAYRRRLLPGSVLLFDNWRVLHARDAYTGYRRLAGLYLNKEDIDSRLRALRARA